jgi:hypothetical protein
MWPSTDLASFRCEVELQACPLPFGSLGSLPREILHGKISIIQVPRVFRAHHIAPLFLRNELLPRRTRVNHEALLSRNLFRGPPPPLAPGRTTPPHTARHLPRSNTLLVNQRLDRRLAPPCPGRPLWTPVAYTQRHRHPRRVETARWVESNPQGWPRGDVPRRFVSLNRLSRSRAHQFV